MTAPQIPALSFPDQRGNVDRVTVELYGDRADIDIERPVLARATS